MNAASSPPDVPDAEFRVTFGDGAGGFGCRPDERVLLAMERQARTDIPVGCRGGGCGICRVQVVRGPYRTGPMSRRHITAEDAMEGYALACRLYVQGDLVLVRRPAPAASIPARVTT
ncbi:MAG: 2Fe-2S iron-sulfur cluster binding domain-containing protein [Alphaproteobacteria bacterium]|nr:2Fe-2S iron-sulfur cluster binding domain-containing protein [Alphaproteobacteria bacterium]